MGREMRGRLDKNRLPRRSDKDPEYTGFITIEGQQYWLSGWVDTQDAEYATEHRPAGSKYFSLAARKAEPKQQSRQQPPRQDYDDTDLPF